MANFPNGEDAAPVDPLLFSYLTFDEDEVDEDEDDEEEQPL